MKKEINVSVLVPIYGVEKYIEKCARSLFEQTMKENIEFIFTDDCTKDRSLEILDKVLCDYPDRKKQVTILHHKENMGLAVARVTGLNAAKGEYVIHCDSDDWVDPEMYEKLYKKAKETDADIVGCDCNQIYLDKSEIRKQNFSLPHDELVEELIKGRKIEAYLWNRLIKRNFYLRGGFKASEGTTLLEDMAVTLPMHIATERVAYVPEALYNYRKSETSSMSAELNDKTISSAVQVLSHLAESNSNNDWYEIIVRRLRTFLFYRVLSISARDVQRWKLFELPFIQSKNLPLSLTEKISVWLVKRGFDRLQYGIVLVSKVIFH